EEELGDVLEEYAGGTRGVLWLCRQLLSTVRRHRSPAMISERRSDRLSNVWRDVRYAVRTFRRNPGFATAAIAPIALGVGINTSADALRSRGKPDRAANRGADQGNRRSP